MARIGTIRLAGDNGTYDVGVFEPGDLDYEPLRVKCENGVGVIPLVNPSDSDTPLRVQTDARGVQAINTGLLHTIIDDFEHNNLDAYYGIADTRNPPEIRQQAAHSGNFGLWGRRDARVMSLPQGHPNYESSEQSLFLDHYPSDGDVFEFYTYVQDIISGPVNAINRFHFAKQDYLESSSGYRVWWEPNGDYWRIEKRESGSGTTFDSGRPSWPYREWVRCVVDWRGNGFTATAYRADGRLIDSLSTNDTTFTSGGIGWDNGNYNETYTDDWRIIPNPN